MNQLESQHGKHLGVGEGTYDVFLCQLLDLLQRLNSTEPGLNGGAVRFQEGTDRGEVDDSAFACADEGKERLIHLSSGRQRMGFKRCERTYFQCPIIISLQRQLDILHRILCIDIQPRIIDQGIYAPLFPLYQLDELADGIFVGNIQLGIFYLALGVRCAQLEVYACTRGGIKYNGAWKSEDALTDCFADSSVLEKELVRAYGGNSQGATHSSRDDYDERRRHGDCPEYTRRCGLGLCVSFLFIFAVYAATLSA
jgi:hypothetical protein